MTGTPEAYHSALSNHNPSLPLCANLTFSLTLTFMVLNSLLFLVDYARMVALMVKNLPANVEDIRNMDLIPELGRTLLRPLEKGTATHSSILAWRISWTEEPGGLWSTGLQRVRHYRSDLACMHARM